MQGFFLKTSLRSASWLLVNDDSFFPFKIFFIKENNILAGGVADEDLQHEAGLVLAINLITHHHGRAEPAEASNLNDVHTPRY